MRGGYAKHFRDQVRDDRFDAARWIRDVSGQVAREFPAADAMDHRHAADGLHALREQMLDHIQHGDRVTHRPRRAAVGGPLRAYADFLRADGVETAIDAADRARGIERVDHIVDMVDAGTIDESTDAIAAGRYQRQPPEQEI